MKYVYVQLMGCEINRKANAMKQAHLSTVLILIVIYARDLNTMIIITVHTETFYNVFSCHEGRYL